MLRYLIWRFLQAVVVVLRVTIITFVLLHMLPDPVRAILGERASAENVRQVTKELGLNYPLPVQYFIWLGNLLHLNLGYSYKLDQPVTALLAQRIPKTLCLAGTATVLAVLLAIPWEFSRRSVATGPTTTSSPAPPSSSTRCRPSSWG